MSIWNIERSPVTGELCIIAKNNDTEQCWSIGMLMSFPEAQCAGIEVPYIGNFGQLENCLVFWDNVVNP